MSPFSLLPIRESADQISVSIWIELEYATCLPCQRLRGFYAEGASLPPFNVQNPLSLRGFCMMPDDRQLISLSDTFQRRHSS